MWTLSGSCPLCLTPPCYHLEPPATAALFLCQYGSNSRHRHGATGFARQLYRDVNHSTLWTEAVQARHAYPIVYLVCICPALSRGVRHVREVFERIATGVVRGEARELAGLRGSVS